MSELPGPIMTTVTVLSEASYDDDRVFNFSDRADGSLDRLIDRLIAIRGTIPAEFRDVARCDIDSDYESTSVDIAISYHRPATDAEIAEHAKRDRQYREADDARQRLLYAQLKARYG